MKLAHYLPTVVKNAPVQYHGDWNVTASPLAMVPTIIGVARCRGVKLAGTLPTQE